MFDDDAVRHVPVLQSMEGELKPMTRTSRRLHRNLRKAWGLRRNRRPYFDQASIHLKRSLSTLRHAEIVDLHFAFARRRRREIRFVDVSQQAHRAPKSYSGIIPTIFPNMKLWSYRCKRLVTAKEMMRLQGFDPERLDLRGVSPNAIARMAGNAMSVPVVAAVMASVLSLIHI